MNPAEPYVVIPTHHRWDLLAQAIDAVESASVIVVDDSPDGSLPRSIARRVHAVLRTSGEAGFSVAVNQGLDWAQKRGVEWVLVLNDDAVLEPGSWTALCQARSPAVGVIAPLLIDDQGHASAGVHIRRWGRVKLRSSPPAGSDPVAVSGACMLIRSEERLDTLYRHGMEDFDLCRRIRNQGKRILVISEARCHHRGGASLSPRSREGQRHGVSGHLRLCGGGWRSPLIVGMAVAQVFRESGPSERYLGIWEGWRDWRRRPERYSGKD